MPEVQPRRSGAFETLSVLRRTYAGERGMIMKPETYRSIGSSACGLCVSWLFVVEHLAWWKVGIVLAAMMVDYTCTIIEERMQK